MKLSSFSLVLFGLGVFLPCMQAKSVLRRNKKKNSHPDKHFYAGMIITLDHVHDGIDEDDVDEGNLIDTFISSYKAIDKDNDIQLHSGFVYKSFAIPEDVYDDDQHGESLSIPFNPYQWLGSNTFMVYVDGSCNLCLEPELWDDIYFRSEKVKNDVHTNDFGAELGLVRGSPKHKALQSELCKELIASGDKPLRDLTYCQVEFTYTVTDLAALADFPIENTWIEEELSKTTSHSTWCHLDIDHVLGSTFEESDLGVIATIFKESYNLIHSGATGNTVTDVELLRRVDVPVDKNVTGTDAFYDRVWYIKVDYTCDSGCHLYGKTYTNFFSTQGSLEEAFEALLCLKLQTSGLPAYKHARHCEVHFGVPPSEKAVAAGVVAAVEIN